MWLAKWWTPDTIFVTVLGGMMAVVMSAALFARHPTSVNGSALVPAAVLQNVRAQEVKCQTITNDEDLAWPNTRC